MPMSAALTSRIGSKPFSLATQSAAMLAAGDAAAPGRIRHARRTPPAARRLPERGENGGLEPTDRARSALP